MVLSATMVGASGPRATSSGGQVATPEQLGWINELLQFVVKRQLIVFVATHTGMSVFGSESWACQARVHRWRQFANGPFYCYR